MKVSELRSQISKLQEELKLEMSSMQEKKERVVQKLQEIIDTEGLTELLTIKVNGNGNGTNYDNWYKKVALQKAGYDVKLSAGVYIISKDGKIAATANRGHLSEVTL